jgi:hypothetical protein
VKFEKGAGIKAGSEPGLKVTGNRMKSELTNVRNAYTGALLALQFQMNYLEPDSMILSTEFNLDHVTKSA